MRPCCMHASCRPFVRTQRNTCGARSNTQKPRHDSRLSSSGVEEAQICHLHCPTPEPISNRTTGSRRNSSSWSQRILGSPSQSSSTQTTSRDLTFALMTNSFKATPIDLTGNKLIFASMIHFSEATPTDLIGCWLQTTSCNLNFALIIFFSQTTLPDLIECLLGLSSLLH